MTTKTFSIVIPCYNEENAIKETVDSIHGLFEDRDDVELIVVNDASTDNTTASLEQLKQQYPDLVIVNHRRNKGYGASLKTGISHASGGIIAITDADGSYPNEELLEMFRQLEASDSDMIVGARTADDVVYPFIRKIPKYFLTKYSSWIADFDIPDINSGLRVFRKATYEKYKHILPDGFSFTTTITLAMLTNNHEVKYYTIGYKERIGKSKIQPIRDTLRFVQLILRTGMYFAPLKVFLPVAGGAFLLAMASSVYDLFILDNLTDKTVILLMFSLNFTMFALLADMIDKRS